MSTFRFSLLPFFMIFPLSLMISGCGPQGSGTGDSGGEISTLTHALNPKPSGDLDSIANQLKRFEGQTKFLNPVPHYFRDMRAGDMAESPNAEAKEGRAIQESDIFKVGKKGSKLLYLLNNYRGPQVVSFEDGPDRPKLLSHAGASGHWPQDMYFDQANERLIVLETYWSEEHRFTLGRLVSYDVSDPQQIKIKEVFPIDGQITDSRMVGKVLYIAAQGRGEQNNVYAQVHSYSLEGIPIKPIASLKLPSPLENNELLNIVQTRENGADRYYLLAVLREGSGWFSGHHRVAVVDISSDQGEIIPMVETSIRGTIRERSQMTIKDKTLITVSNYFPPGRNASNDPRNLRIAVESFALPRSAASAGQLLENEEAQYRFFLLDKAMKEKENQLRKQGMSEGEIMVFLETYRENLITGKELYKGHSVALKNFYIKGDSGNEGLLKILTPNSVLTVGSTENLHATIQDVRFSGDKLFVFWVPQNLIDPLDVFDISHPREKIAYHGRLQFDGWIEKAVPIKYQDKDYIVGLGHIVPNVNNERNLRYPQAMLFQIEKNQRGALEKKVVSQMNFKTSQIWANFNVPDKFIEFRFNPETGTGAIMFQVYQWNSGRFLSGGKLIGFDLNGEEVFSEGGLLTGPSNSWLRRVFSNPEIEKINTFTDRELSTYDVDLQTATMGEHDQLFKAINTLELARNIRGYFNLALGSKQFGVQIVSDYSYTPYPEEEGENNRPKTELRFVPASRADTEKGQILHLKSLPGSFVDSLKIDDTTYLLQTEEYIKTAQPEAHQLKIYLTIATLDENLVPLIQTQNIALPQVPAHSLHRYYFRDQQNLIRLPSGQIFLIKDQSLFEISKEGLALTLSPLIKVNCQQALKREEPSLLFLNGKFLMTSSETVRQEGWDHLEFKRHFINEIKLKNGGLSCGPSLNIPGTPLAIHDKRLITYDQVLLDPQAPAPTPVADPGVSDPVASDSPEEFYPLAPFRRVSTKNHLSSLRLSQVATLADLYEANHLDMNAIKTIKDLHLTFFEGETTRSPVYYPYSVHSRRWRPPFPLNSGESTLTFLTTNQQARFVKESFLLQEHFDSLPRFGQIFPVTKDSYFGLVLSGRKARVLKFNLEDARPRFMKLTKVGTNLEKEKSSGTFVEISSPYWYGDSRTGANYNPLLNTMELAEGDFGITQFFIETI